MTSRSDRQRRREPLARAAGFTLFESIFVLAMLTICAVALTKMMPRVFATQNQSREAYTGLVQMQACAERLVGIRRHVGYTGVTTTSCSGLTGLDGFNAPAVALVDAAGASVSACASTSATCTATITIAKGSGPAVAISALTLQFQLY